MVNVMKIKVIIILMGLVISLINLSATEYHGFDGGVNPPLEAAIRTALQLNAAEPITVEALDALEKLELSNFHNITSLAGLPAALPRLCQLYLSNTRITSLENFPDLPELRILDLSYTGITSLENFPQCPKLYFLNLSNTGITGLAGLPASLPNLLQLYLSNTAIASLAGLPAALPNLWKLDLSNTGITSLENFPDLPELRILDLSYTGITSLENFPQCPKLYFLNLSNTGITGLVNFPDLPELQILDLSYTRITSLENFPQCPELRKLHLADIHLDNTDSLGDLHKFSLLKIICNGKEFSVNEFIQFYNSIYKGFREQSNPPLYAAIQRQLYYRPITIKALDDLRELDLSDSEITSLAGLPAKLPNLRQLTVTGFCPDDFFPRLPELQKLTIKKADIEVRFLEELSSNCPKLEKLDFSDCSFQDDIQKLQKEVCFSQLRILDLSGTHDVIYFLRSLLFLPSLRVINLSDSDIVDLAVIPPFPGLKELYLDNTRITSLDNFPNLPELRCLGLEDTRITSLDNFPNLPELRELALSNTLIVSLKGLPEALPRLRILDLSDTKITNLIGLPVSLAKLRELDLSNTPIVSLKGLPENLPRLRVLNLTGTLLRRLDCFPEVPLRQFWVGPPYVVLFNGEELIAKDFIERYGPRLCDGAYHPPLDEGGEEFPPPITESDLHAETLFDSNNPLCNFETTKMNSLDTDGNGVFQVTGSALILSPFIPIQFGKRYRLSGSFQSVGSEGPSKLLFGYATYTINEEEITVQSVNYHSNTETELFRPCTSLDTELYVRNATNWKVDPLGNVAFEIDSTGGFSDLPNFNLSLRGITRIEPGSDHAVVHLANSCGKDYPAGTKIREHTIPSGQGGYLYTHNVLLPEKDWTTVYDGLRPWNNFRHGTSFVRIVIIANHNQGPTYVTEFKDILLEEEDDTESEWGILTF